MIAVITGLLQRTGFLWECLVFPGICLSQALAEAIHRSLWKQRDNLSVSHPLSCLAAEYLQKLSDCLCSVFKTDTFAGPVVLRKLWSATHFNLRCILFCFVFSCELQVVTQECVIHFFFNFWDFILYLHWLVIFQQQVWHAVLILIFTHLHTQNVLSLFHSFCIFSIVFHYFQCRCCDVVVTEEIHQIVSCIWCFFLLVLLILKHICCTDRLVWSIDRITSSKKNHSLTGAQYSIKYI